MTSIAMGKQAGERMLSDLRDLNLNFLLLAQKMLHADRTTAKTQLGLSEDIAERLLQMGTTELLQLASTSVSLCTLRYDDLLLLNTATQAHADPRLAGLHASILSFRPSRRTALAGQR
ncbi:flagellar transcriptional regulator FlhD [Limnobacter sp.]|uniref:flagellar transcriptional regulator FlhD n=1 Tax=Limnobacter sp. TaxID=2003368 RepID=UPI003512ADED